MQRVIGLHHADVMDKLQCKRQQFVVGVGSKETIVHNLPKQREEGRIIAQHTGHTLARLKCKETIKYAMSNQRLGYRITTSIEKSDTQKEYTIVSSAWTKPYLDISWEALGSKT